ncbi:hypothetical protein ACFQU7_28740 [Pseudoroseomonas wenyumeiae]
MANLYLKESSNAFALIPVLPPRRFTDWIGHHCYGKVGSAFQHRGFAIPK